MRVSRRQALAVGWMLMLALMVPLLPAAASEGSDADDRPPELSHENGGHSHFRYGHIFWSPGHGPGSVEFTVHNAWRRSAYSGTFGGVCVDPTAPGVPTTTCSGSDGHPEPGDVIHEAVAADTTLRPGDGTVIGSPRGNLLYLVTSVDPANDWLFGVAIDPKALPQLRPTIEHTYSDVGQYVAFIATCCRIGTTAVNQHINNSNASYRVETRVNTEVQTGSPVSVLPPIVRCPIDGVCRFTVPATDPSGDAARSTPRHPRSDRPGDRETL